MKQALSRLAAPLALLAVLLIVDFIAYPGFFKLTVKDGQLIGNLVDILNRAAPTVIISTGMVLVIATGGVDLSVGAVMAIAGAASAFVLTKADAAKEGETAVMVRALFTGLGTGVLGGAVNALLVSIVEIQPIIATLLLMVAGRGVAQLITDGQILTFHNTPFEALGSGSLMLLPRPVWIALGVVLLVSALTRLTSFGLFLESVGANAVASRLSGVPVKAVKALAYVFCGLAAALAGMVMSADIKAADANNAGLYFELDAILAVALGGTSLSGGRFSLAGAVVGALLMQTLTTTVNSWGMDKSATLILKAVLVVGVCVLQSDRVRASLEPVFKRRSAA